VLRDLDYNNPLNNNGGCLCQVLWLAVAVAVCFLMGGCKTKYVAVPEYHNVYVEKHDTLIARDSIYEKDSIYIVKNGDTVTAYRDRIYYRDRWRDKIVYRDSIKTDSVRVPVPVVTNKVGRKDKIAYIGIGLIISFFIWIFCTLRVS
jgi:hypothetical protein